MATNTIGASGADYTSIAAWSAAVKAIGTLSEDEVGELIDDASYAYGAQSDLQFTDALRNGFEITLRGSGSGVHDGTVSSGARVAASAVFGGLYRPEFCTLEDFIVHNTQATSGGSRCFVQVGTATIRRMVLKADSTGNNSDVASIATATVESCLLISAGAGGDGTALTTSDVDIYNTTIVGAKEGISTSATHTGTIQNVVIYDCGTDWQGTFSGTYSHNADEDDTKPSGTGNVTLTTDPFVDSASDDYTPSTSGQLDGAGTSSAGVTTDLLGDTFNTPPSIGAIEVASGGSTDALLADDVESNSEVSSPAVGQTHGLLSVSVESLTELTLPSASATSTDVLTADDVETTSELTAPQIAQVHNVLGDDVQSLTELSSPAVGQVHSLLSVSVESSSELTAPVLFEPSEDTLLAEDIESLTELSVPTLREGLASIVQGGGGWFVYANGRYYTNKT